MSATLNYAQITEELTKVEGWRHRGNAIEKVFECKNFDGSIAFVNELAKVAHEIDHHPDIQISWGEVILTLSSHDVGGLTERDFTLARAIDAL